jgi:selenocysteine-specific elongation factor
LANIQKWSSQGFPFGLNWSSPQETIGGGWVIDPRGSKYRFGNQTIDELEKKKVGSPRERITAALIEAKSLPLAELIKLTALDEAILIQHLDNPEFVFYNGMTGKVKLINDSYGFFKKGIKKY